jgi:predicted nuclease with TOPRIM domain
MNTFNQKLEEVTNENESLKLKLENYNHRVDSIENERNPLRCMPTNREARKWFMKTRSS